MTQLTAIALFALALCACSKAPEPVQTVSYYREHADQRLQRVSQCAEDPGRRRADPDCVNATRAAALEDIGSLEKLPPMGLMPSPTGPADRDTDDASRVRP